MGIFKGDATLNATRLVVCFLMHYTQYPEIDKSLKMFQYLIRNDDKVLGKSVLYPAFLCFMKLFGCLVAETGLIYVVIRYDNVTSVFGGFITLGIVARLDTIMAMTLPSTLIDTPLYLKK